MLIEAAMANDVVRCKKLIARGESELCPPPTPTPPPPHPPHPPHIPHIPHHTPHPPVELRLAW